MATIPNYSAPQSTVAQQLAVVANLAVASRHATVIGPAFQLQRYGIDPDVTLSDFHSDGLTVPFRFKLNATAAEELKGAGNTVDEVFTRVFGKGLEAEYLSSAGGFKLEALSQPTIIRLQGGSNVAGSSLLAGLRGRPVAVGDRVVITTAAGTRARYVTGLVGRSLSATYGSDDAGTNLNLGNSSYNPVDAGAGAITTVSAPAGFTIATDDPDDFNGLVKGAMIDGKYGEEFILTVATGGVAGVATFNIASVSGLFVANNVASTSDAGAYELVSAAGLGGLTITITSTVGAVIAGQQFRFRVTCSYARITTAQLDLSDTGGGYLGARDTTYVVRVKTGTAAGYAGAVLSISDTSGVDVASEVVVANNTNFNIGTLGLRAQFVTAPGLPVQGGLRTGDSYYVKVIAVRSSTSEFNGIVLDGPAVDTSLFTDASVALTTVSLRIPFTGEILATDAEAGSAWTVDPETGVEISAGLSLYVNDRDAGYQWIPFVTGQGALGITWRAMLAPTAQPVYVNSLDLISSNFGRITPANTLAFGAWRALDAGQAIYVQAVASDDVDGYTAAFSKISNADKFYSIAVLNNTRAVRQLLATHLSTLSTKQKKRWRIGWASTESPGSYAVVSTTSLGGSFLATISAYSGGNRLVTVTNFTTGDGFVTRGVAPQDRFLTADGEFAVESVLSNSELLLVAGPTYPVAPAAPFTVFKADTTTSQSDYVAEESQALGDRRCHNLWTEGGTAFYDGVLQTVPVMFAAAEYAGVAAALAPQQGFTRRSVTTITSASPTFARYQEDELNKIAAAGTMVLAEDADQGGVFVRHQLTTGVDGGLLYYESSITRVADALSFQLKAIVDALVGNRNVTRDTLARIDHNVVAMLTAATQATSTTADIGPLIVDYRNLRVQQDPILLDRVTLTVDIDVAVPLNGVDASANYYPATITIAL